MGINISDKPTIDSMLKKLAWVESVLPTIEQNPATKKLTEKLIRSNVRKQYTTGNDQDTEKDKEKKTIVSEYRVPIAEPEIKINSKK